MTECRTVDLEIAPLCTVVIPMPIPYTGVTTLHRGTIPIATVLHSATERFQEDPEIWSGEGLETRSGNGPDRVWALSGDISRRL